MKNVRLHVDQWVVLDVERLRGVMISKSETPPVFDDQNSFTLNIVTGTVCMDMSSLGNLMNRHVFGYEGAPLKNIRVGVEEGRVRMSGSLRKGIDVPFSTKAAVGVTSDGRLQLHVESIKAAGLPAKGLLGFLGLELDDLVSLKERRGVEIQDNDILISPGQVLPPPQMRGRVTQAAVRGGCLVQVFGDASGRTPEALKLPSPSARNYIYFGGGDIRFGKLTMHDADLQLIDSDPRDPFDFFPAKYQVQLVAGYSKNTPQRGLKTFMPDYNDVATRAASVRRP